MSSHLVETHHVRLSRRQRPKSVTITRHYPVDPYAGVAEKAVETAGNIVGGLIMFGIVGMLFASVIAASESARDGKKY